MKKNRWVSALLAVMLAFALLPAAAWAAEVETAAGANLTGAERKIYEAMAEHIAEVAAGRTTGTQITITFEDEELGWTAQELGLSRVDDQSVEAPLHEKVGEILDKIYTCLELDYPFEMFWANNYWNWMWNQQHTDGKVWITRMDYSIDVTPAYRGGSMTTTNPDKIAQAGKSLEAAKSIVQANEGKTDYEKLTAYRDEICRLTSYNYKDYELSMKDADRFGRDHTYGDPWQLVYVFDGDPNTNVVCEGYSKAFKLLCDLSDFNGDVTCYLAEGKMDGGDHMWNVVKMGDGEFYLVDVTNSDTGMSGERGGLFLAGASGSGQKYVVSNGNWQITYVYREDQENLFLDGYLPVSSTAYSPENDPAGAVPAFTDVPEWCAKEAAWASFEGITNGYGGSTTFAPGVECPHTQILTFLWRAADEPAAEKSPFTVAEPYQGAVDWAYEKGLIDDEFNPDAPCTRSQAVRYIWLALDAPEASKSAGFSDVDAGAPYAEAVSWAVENGVTNGDGSEDTFAPDKVCSRGHIVTFLYRAYHN